MRAILMSIKPDWWKRIASGEKTLEIRKSYPADTLANYRVFAYVSGTGLVMGEFASIGVFKTADFERLQKRSCVPLAEMEEYAGGRALCAWDIHNAREYKIGISFRAFGIRRPPMSWRYIEIPDDWEAENGD